MCACSGGASDCACCACSPMAAGFDRLMSCCIMFESSSSTSCFASSFVWSSPCASTGSCCRPMCLSSLSAAASSVACREGIFSRRGRLSTNACLWVVADGFVSHLVAVVLLLQWLLGLWLGGCRIVTSNCVVLRGRSWRLCLGLRAPVQHGAVVGLIVAVIR